MERTIESLVNCVPNLLDDRVPQGEDEKDNVVIRYHTEGRRKDEGGEE